MVLLEAPTAEEVLRFEGFEDKSDENKGKLIKKVGVKSEFWKHFLVWSNKPWIGACIKCLKDKEKEYEVVICKKGASVSTSKLENHLIRKHNKITKQAALFNATNVLDKQLASTSKPAKSSSSLQPKIGSIFRKEGPAPNFSNYYVDWIIEKYQAINTCEEPSFCKMCLLKE